MICKYNGGTLISVIKNLRFHTVKAKRDCNINSIPYTAKEETILAVHDVVKPWFEEMYKSRPKKRYVDFNGMLTLEDAVEWQKE